VLSPLVKDNRVLAALSAGRPELFDRFNVVGFRVDLDAMATLAYEPNFEVQLRRLETDQLRALPADSEIDAFLRSISHQRK